MKRIPIVLSLNIEPDPRMTNVANPEPWTGYEKTYEYFKNLRMPLEDMTQSKVNYVWMYRMDHQVEVTYGDPAWAINKYPHIMKYIEQRGDAVGLHPHSWQWQEETASWNNEFADQAWLDFVIEDALENFKHTFGRNCEIFQFGDQFMNTKIMNLLRKRGVKYDMSVEPGYHILSEEFPGEKWVGFELDTRGVGRMPYYPSASDFRKPSLLKDAGLITIPVSTGLVWYEFGRMERLYRRMFHPEMLKKKVRTLNLGFLPQKHFAWIVEDMFKEMQNPFLSIVLRSEACSDPFQRKHVEQNMEFLMNHAFSDRFVFLRPEELVSYFSKSEEEPENHEGATELVSLL